MAGDATIDLTGGLSAKTWAAIAVVLIGGVGAAVLFTGPSSDTGRATGAASATGGTQSGAVQKSLTIENGRYTPGSITVSRGDTVELTVTNNDGQPHSIQAPPFRINKKLPAGQTTTVTFTASRSGRFAPCDGYGNARFGITVR